MGTAPTAPYVFITGGASGLGLALARQYLAAGAKVAIGDCDASALARVMRSDLVGALAFQCDVRVEADLLAAAEALLAAWGRIDLVFNNAGVAVAGSIEDTPLGDWQWIVDINLMGVVRGCRVFVPLMRRQGHGRIINISSMAGLLSPPAMSAYCATKAAVVALSEVMQVELHGSGVGVCVVCPAFFRTGLALHSRAVTSDLRATVEQLVSDSPVSADEIAQRVRSGVARRQFLILTHRAEGLIWVLKRVLPQAWFSRLMIANMARIMAHRTARRRRLP